MVNPSILVTRSWTSSPGKQFLQFPARAVQAQSPLAVQVPRVQTREGRQVADHLQVPSGHNATGETCKVYIQNVNKLIIIWLYEDNWRYVIELHLNAT
jgi:hypothetical protein